LRALTAGEIQQIGGRAGRYGLMEDGIVGATTRHNLTYIRKMFYQELEPLTHAHVAPTVEDLEIIPGSLSQRFITWMELCSIPKKLRNVVRTADLEERIQLSGMLTDDEVNRLGLTQAVKLVNAPTRESSRWYWYDCAQAIIQQKPMPLPPTPPYFIGNTHDLEDIEASINYADIYLWLSQREEFSHLAFHERRYSRRPNRNGQTASTML
jgi:ATP-dependent RNA helicase SUPV3L1/SUV3